MPTPSALDRTSRDDGFTLVELLVVIIMIAILAGIAVPLFLGQRGRAYDAAAKADLRNLAMAVTAELQAGHGNYTPVHEMSITVAETPDGGRRYVMSGVRGGRERLRFPPGTRRPGTGVARGRPRGRPVE